MSYTPIRYDKKSEKEWIIRLVISLSIILLYIIILFIEANAFVSSGINPLSDSSLFTVFFVFLSVLEYIAVPVFVISILKVLDSYMYLKRLKKNYFEVPVDKKIYEKNLSNVPRTKVVENVYARDSWIGAIFFLIGYIAFVTIDICYVVKWTSLGETDSIMLFVLMMIAHLSFLILAIILFRQKDTSRYIDEIDVKTSGELRKTRISLPKAITIFVIITIIFAFGVTMAFSMTKYIYKSRHGSYDKTIDEFKDKATMTVTSEDLQDGKWNDRITNTENGENLSPEISFDKVEGAEYYFIYMVDETANNWVHWVATDVREEELGTGANIKEYKDNPDFKYVGPYPPAGSGEHTYTIYVYALKGKPDSDIEPEFDEVSFSGDYMYYDYLSISRRGNPNEYGNVISYGYLSGTFTN